MSALERRLQLLLDQARYDKVAAEARRTGRSVAAVIREAIDEHVADPDQESRAAAARRLLELADRNRDEEPTQWAEVKAAMDAELDRKFS